MASTVRQSPATSVPAARQSILQAGYGSRAAENPNARLLYSEVKNLYPTVSFLGVWGDPAHQKRKSDHNTGDAVDIGFGKNKTQGSAILQYVLQNPNVKYAILGRDVYYPDGRISRGGTKFNHDTHVHVSFLSDGKTNGQTGQAAGPTTPTPTGAGPVQFSQFAGSTFHNTVMQAVNKMAGSLGIDPNSVYIQDGQLYARKVTR